MLQVIWLLRGWVLLARVKSDSYWGVTLLPTPPPTSTHIEIQRYLLSKILSSSWEILKPKVGKSFPNSPIYWFYPNIRVVLVMYQYPIMIKTILKRYEYVSQWVIKMETIPLSLFLSLILPTKVSVFISLSQSLSLNLCLSVSVSESPSLPSFSVFQSQSLNLGLLVSLSLSLFFSLSLSLSLSIRIGGILMLKRIVNIGMNQLYICIVKNPPRAYWCQYRYQQDSASQYQYMVLVLGICKYYLYQRH